MSIFRPSDECPTCFKLAGYAGLRASQDELRKHLACTCPSDYELEARERLLDLTVQSLGDGRHRVAA